MLGQTPLKSIRVCLNNGKVYKLATRLQIVCTTTVYLLTIFIHSKFSFTGLSYDNLIKPLDPWNDLEDNYGKGAMKRFTNLKRTNPDLKTLVAIGGKCSLLNDKW